MGDPEYEKEYLRKKKELRRLHNRLKETKETQEIYHKIMGSRTDNPDTEEDSEDDI